MNVVTPKLPASAEELFNTLYESNDPDHLTDDLYAARLPGNITIGVGWLPEYDPNGRYKVSAWQGSYENQLMLPNYTQDVKLVKQIVEWVAAALAPPPLRIVSGSAASPIGRRAGEPVFASGSVSSSIPLRPTGS